METVLVSSGYRSHTLVALRQHWDVVDIPSHEDALAHLTAAQELPAAVAIGYVTWPEAGVELEWDSPASSARNLPAHVMLQRVLELDRDLPVVISTGESRPGAIVEFVKRGAFDYVIEPRDDPRHEVLEQYTQDLVLALRRAVQWRVTLLENRRLKERLVGGAVAEKTQARSPAMRRVMELVRKVAPTPATVLVTGDSGTGKEVVARSIHDGSDRAGEPFLAVNCGALSESLLTSELFGHAKGAFTGADVHHEGLVRQAGAGTLFLDEVGSISPSFQVMLLRVLEQRVARPVGAAGEYPVRCRFIAAANRDLEQMARDGDFREDLYYRLNVFHIHLPPLRERPEDIPVLAQFFLSRTAREYGRDISGLEPAVMELLERYPWPGNVRQLRNAIERAVILCEGRRIAPVDLADHLRSEDRAETGDEDLDYHHAMRHYETRLIRSAMRRAGKNVSKAARLLGMKRTTLSYRVKQLGLREQ